MSRVKQLESIQQEAKDLFEKKNRDYGDAFATYGTIGVLIRMQDKIQRAVSISNSQITLVESETLRDTLLDLHNYSAMAIMLMENYNNQKRKKWGDGRYFTDAEMLEDSKPNAWE